jgi:hypothetical protein
LDGRLKIETFNNRWEKVPVFTPSRKICRAYKAYDGKQFAVEKLHPENFNFDVNGFLDTVCEVEEKGTCLKFIYLVRDPSASLVSFMNYQQRTPDWYEDTKEDTLLNYMIRTYEALSNLAKARNGIIIDYTELTTRLNTVLGKVYFELWPDPDDQERYLLQQISLIAGRLTARNLRTRSGSPFFGKLVGPQKGDSGQYSAFFERYAKEVDTCDRYYRLLLDSRNPSPSPAEFCLDKTNG